MMRVALVGPQAPPQGGMAGQFSRLCRRLREEGCTVHPVVMNAPYAPAWVGRVRGLRAVFRLVPYIARLWRVCGEVEVMHVMANSGWAFHLFATPAVWVARLRGVPVVMSYHGGLARAFCARNIRWLRPTLQRAQLIVPSGFLKAVFAEFGVHATVVPNSVELPVVASAPRRRGAQVVVTRNLEPIYDIATALRAFEIVHRQRPHARLTIAGSGPELEALVALSSSLGIAGRVRFAGRLSPFEIAALYREADVMLNPSLADNMPNCLLEAWAHRVPVVSTRAGGVPWLAQHNHTALLVPPGEVAPMANALMRLIDHPGLARRLADNAAREVAQYQWPHIRPKLLAAYQTARDGQGGARARPGTRG